MVKGFDEAKYTADREVKTLLAIQAHATDGSALEGCTCLQGKHFYELEGNSEEGALIATREQEKDFYAKMAPFARAARKEIVDGTFKFPSEIKVSVEGNPRTRAFLPHGLTACEASHPAVKAKLSSCIKDAEVKCCGGATKDYGGCTCNPVAVCRAAISCP